MDVRKYMAAACAAVVAMAGCSGSSAGKKQEAAKADGAEVVFDADSAYAFVERQCAFGERVPNTAAHEACGDWLAAKLRSYGADVTEQRAELRAFDGTTLRARNIVGSFYPGKERRVLLIAHWDCRPWADADPDPANRRKPVMGANDGASGVGVLLEMARLLRRHEPATGVDILFVDAEDWGDGGDDSSWALGTQHWVDNPTHSSYSYGILLDMVGDGEATFRKEYFSLRYAPSLVERIWAAARGLGYGNRFVDEPGGAVTDDHVFVNAAGIPCVDIIDQRPDSPTGFCPQWHTADDTMDHIDRSALKAVGQTLAGLLLEK